FEHNTIYNLGIWGMDNMTNLIMRNNILTGNDTAPNLTGSTGSIFLNQLCFAAGQCSGSNLIVGVPTFVGGSSPTTWAGFQLTSGSLGYRNGSDGNDRGINYYGPGVIPSSGTSPLAAPMNLRVI
ncbi:MAG: hypothetical protein ACXVB1_08500, partial [Pseudobdellovibrionaceae bacterium]